MSFRRRQGYVSLNGGEPSSTVAKAGLGLAVVALITAAVLGGIALAKVSDTTIDGSTIHDLKITGQLDLSMTDMIVPPPWHEPIGGPVVRHGGRVVVEELSLEKTDILIGGEAIHITIDLSRNELHNKDFHIYSRSAFAHRVIITTTTGFWDKQERFKTLLFDNKPGCFVVFRVVDIQSVMIKEAQGVRACTDGLEQCEGAITSLIVENLEVGPSFNLFFFIILIFY